MRALTVSKEQTQVFATAIRPQIKQYIEDNREKYEAWFKSEYQHEISKSIECDER